MVTVPARCALAAGVNVPPETPAVVTIWSNFGQILVSAVSSGQARVSPKEEKMLPAPQWGFEPFRLDPAREHGEPGDDAASGSSLTSMAGCTRMAGLLRV
jgi:hypothetical protein